MAPLDAPDPVALSRLPGQGLRVGVAGTGFVGALHACSARLAGARLVGVAASTPERGHAAASAMGAERAFDTANELAGSGEVDVVHVAPRTTSMPSWRRPRCARASTIGGEEPDGMPNFADGARSADIVDAVLRSAAQDGAWVDVAGGAGGSPTASS